MKNRIRYKTLIVILPFLLGVSKVISQTFHHPGFLEGTWKVENKQTYEAWTKQGEGHYKGVVFNMNGDKKVIKEHLEIKQEGDSFIYYALVPGQNKDKTIAFKQKEAIKSLVFENQEHDFPKKIIYSKPKNNRILVQVLGEGEKGFSFSMTRQDP